MTKKTCCFSQVLLVLFMLFSWFAPGYPASVSADQPIIIDHTCTDITKIPESAINQAKAFLHIAYGHTSHGSQLTSGMTGLVGFANGGGLGLLLPHDIFKLSVMTLTGLTSETNSLTTPAIMIQMAMAQEMVTGRQDGRTPIQRVLTGTTAAQLIANH